MNLRTIDLDSAQREAMEAGHKQGKKPGNYSALAKGQPAPEPTAIRLGLVRK